MTFEEIKLWHEDRKPRAVLLGSITDKGIALKCDDLATLERLRDAMIARSARVWFTDIEPPNEMEPRFSFHVSDLMPKAEERATTRVLKSFGVQY